MTTIANNQPVAHPREPFLDQKSYTWVMQYLGDEAIPGSIRDLQTGLVRKNNIGYAYYYLGADYFKRALLRYSGGADVSSMKDDTAAAVAEFERNIDSNAPAMEFCDLAVQTYYVEALWLLSLTKLLDLGEQMERVASLYTADETNDGADELFEALLGKLGRKSLHAEGLIHEDPYQLLLDCIKSDAAQRPALMTAFLQRWFRGQRECDWWGSHVPRKGSTVLDTGFFGYWAFEAALVTFLWEIDDASYRDLPYYPKALIDHAREHATLKS